MGKQLTTQDFISRAKAIHGDVYDYSISKYVGASAKIKIGCPVHGVFEQKASHHTNGTGCSKCGFIISATKNKLGVIKFIEKAKSIHNDKYIYSSVEYKNAHTKIILICPEHGVFEQIPNSHLRGRGCPKCGDINTSLKKRMDCSEFIDRANNVHDSKYDYSYSNYVTAHVKVKIICPDHGEFEISPANHLSGQRCPKCGDIICGGKNRYTTDEFVKLSTSIHGQKYDYSQVEYTLSKNKVRISCPEHGVFEQEANSHLQGTGCPGCSVYGFDRSKPAYLYLLRSKCGRYMKIGITHYPDQRHSQLTRRTPFEFDRIEVVSGLGSDVAEMEKKLLGMSEPVVFQQPFDGYTEWRLWSEELHHILVSF